MVRVTFCFCGGLRSLNALLLCHVKEIIGNHLRWPSYRSWWARLPQTIYPMNQMWQPNIADKEAIISFSCCISRALIRQSNGHLFANGFACVVTETRVKRALECIACGRVRLDAWGVCFVTRRRSLRHFLLRLPAARQRSMTVSVCVPWQLKRHQFCHRFTTKRIDRQRCVNCQ